MEQFPSNQIHCRRKKCPKNAFENMVLKLSISLHGIEIDEFVIHTKLERKRNLRCFLTFVFQPLREFEALVAHELIGWALAIEIKGISIIFIANHDRCN